MSVYLVEAAKASCRVSGCACHDRVPRYPSDVTDAEWELLRPQAQAVMAELRRGPGGRPMEHDLRAVLDAIGYVTRMALSGGHCRWTFPPGRRCMPFSNDGTRGVCRRDWSTGFVGVCGWRAAALSCPLPDRLIPNR